MSDQFNWGALEPVPSIRRVPRLKRGQVLFFVRNGVIEFPHSDRRVWPWDAISSIGYLNLEPISFGVEVTALTSKDGIGSMCVVQLEVQLKNEPEWHFIAAKRQSGLRETFRLAVTEAAQKVFKTFDYKSLLLVDEQVRLALQNQISQEIISSTPYNTRRILLDSVASVHDELDKSIRTAKAAEIGSVEISRTAELDAKIESERLERLRMAEIADAEHGLGLRRKRDEADREGAREDKRNQIEIDAQSRHHELKFSKLERSQDLELMKLEDHHKVELIGSVHQKLSGDIQFYMAYNHPELWTKMQMSDSQSQREVAIALQQIMNAQAHDQGVTATLQRVMEQLQIGLNMNRIGLSVDGDKDINSGDEKGTQD